MKKFLESEEFYNLMQNYRNAHLHDQTDVIEKFETVKIAIINQFEKSISLVQEQDKNNSLDNQNKLKLLKKKIEEYFNLSEIIIVGLSFLFVIIVLYCLIMFCLQQ